MNGLIVDIETTGLEPEEHEITVLGCGDGYGVYTITGDERGLVRTAEQLMGMADVVVGYNILKFDARFIRERAKVHSVGPSVRIRVVDLYKVVKSRFQFSCYKLPHVVEELAGVSCGEDITGAEAARLSQCGELEKVEEHCAKDVFRTHHLYMALVRRGVLEEKKLMPWLSDVLGRVANGMRVREHKLC